MAYFFKAFFWDAAALFGGLAVDKQRCILPFLASVRGFRIFCGGGVQ
jgi:hypothetical protein